jgi:alpha,alpha-trehalase
MAGCVNMIQEGYTGMEPRGNVLRFNPYLPEELGRLRMHIRYRGHHLCIDISPDMLKISAGRAREKPIKIGYKEDLHILEEGGSLEIALNQ